MARTMYAEDTDIYRMKVDIKLDDGGVITRHYGPHDTPGQARDYSVGYRLNSKRLTKQKLGPALGWFEGHTEGLGMEWNTVSVKYRNGGELVDWDD